MAIANGNYKCLCLDIGINGRVSDGGVFRDSLMSKYINNNNVNLPENIKLRGTNLCTPYVFVGDDEFPLTNRIMKPFRYHGLSKEKKFTIVVWVVQGEWWKTYSGFRRIVWVLLNPIRLNVEKMELMLTACCILHNFLITQG